MKRRLILSLMAPLVAAVIQPASADNVLFIDLNNSAEEIKACSSGVKTANAEESVFVINKETVGLLPGSGFVPNAENKIHVKEIDAMIRDLEDQGQRIDSIVISGHDGNGQYFGTQGDLTAAQLKWIFDRHPMLKRHTTMMMQWGCYTGNANACENIWGRNVSENIRTTVGFTVQSPDNTKPGNFRLLEDVCKKRKDIQAAQSSQQYDDIFRNLAGVSDWNVGICHDGGVCSPDYAERDPVTGKILPGQNCDHTFDELQRRCAEFDPDQKKLETYQHYLNADPGYEDPPPDDASFVYENGATGRNPIRRYYSELHLWRHCAKSAANPNGFEMESPARVIRLVRFNDVKSNLMKFHAREVQQYNDLMTKLGWNDYALADLQNMSRAQIVKRTMGAVASLEANIQYGKSQVKGVDLKALYSMAVQFDRTLRVLQPRCSPQSWVHAGMGDYPSDCIAPYGKAPKWPEPKK
jgi:hypothetical protein